MIDKQKYTPDDIKTILYASQTETEHNPVLLAISALYEEGVRSDIIAEALSTMGPEYSEDLAAKGSMLKYKIIREENSEIKAMPGQGSYLLN